MTAPYLPLYVNEFLAEVGCLSIEEAGAYVRLLCHAWKQEPVGTLPDNDDLLARFAGMQVAKWQECKPMVLSAFKIGNDGRWHHALLRAEFERMRRYSKSRQENAKKRHVPSTDKAHAKHMQAHAEDKPAISSSLSTSNKNTALRAVDSSDPPDHKRLMSALQERFGAISDGAAQGKAAKWILEHGYTVEQSIECLDALRTEDWRQGRVSWLNVQKEIGSWLARQKPQPRKKEVTF
jgi:uncharacterized protein YdaU (DUF1376 family)